MYVIRSKDKVGYVAVDHSGDAPILYETSFLKNAKFFNDDKLYDAEDYLECLPDYFGLEAEFEVCEVKLEPVK